MQLTDFSILNKVISTDQACFCFAFVFQRKFKTLSASWGSSMGVPIWVFQKGSSIKIINKADKDDQ